METLYLNITTGNGDLLERVVVMLDPETGDTRESVARAIVELVSHKYEVEGV